MFSLFSLIIHLFEQRLSVVYVEGRNKLYWFEQKFLSFLIKTIKTKKVTAISLDSWNILK